MEGQRNAVIIRGKPSAHGTFGSFYLDDGWTCKTGELPWKDNIKDFSCISPGRYICTFLKRSASGKYRNVYHVRDVENRTGVLIHAGNFCGDTTKGLRSHVRGCILLGTKHGVLGTQRAVLSSKKAVLELARRLNGASLNLLII